MSGGGVKVTQHWRQRVAERIGLGICPDLLASALLTAIDARRDDLVAYLGRVRRDGMRAFRFRVSDGRYFVALIESDRRAVVTVLVDGPLKLARGDTVRAVPSAPAAQPVLASRYRRPRRRRTR